MICVSLAEATLEAYLDHLKRFSFVEIRLDAPGLTEPDIDVLFAQTARMVAAFHPMRERENLALARLADLADRWLIAGLAVRGTHGSIELTGRLLRLVQTGNLQTYAFLFAIGVALVLYLALF